MIITEGELANPIGFGEFCRRYKDDEEFLAFFDQLHMFVSFHRQAGRTVCEPIPTSPDRNDYRPGEPPKVSGRYARKSLTEYHPKERNIIDGGKDRVGEG